MSLAIYSRSQELEKHWIFYTLNILS